MRLIFKANKLSGDIIYKMNLGKILRKITIDWETNAVSGIVTIFCIFISSLIISHNVFLIILILSSNSLLLSILYLSTHLVSFVLWVCLLFSFVPIKYYCDIHILLEVWSFTEADWTNSMGTRSNEGKSTSWNLTPVHPLT